MRITIFRAVFFLAFVALHSQSFAQSLKAYERAGDKAFEKKDYNAAIQHYAAILKGDQNNWDVRWKYAECARMFNAFAEAEKSYKKIADNKKAKKQFPLLNLRRGELRKAQGNYAEAIVFFNDFIEEKQSSGVEQTYIDKAKAEIEACKTATALAQNPPKIEITHPGKEINSPYSDFGSIIHGDTLYFSSYKFEKKKDNSNPKGRVTKMLSSIKGARAREIGQGFPSVDSAHVANGAITKDGKFFFFTFCKNLNVNDIRCEMYLSVKDKKNKWSKPMRLPEPVNMKGYTTTHPAIEADANGKNRKLWFASDRPGGKGKLDIWSVALDSAWFCPCMSSQFDGKKSPKLPNFANPLNEQTLNTAGNDATPYFHTPSATLYFSADERPGLGGYDIFLAKKSGNTFESPQNAGLGINSAYNDLYPFVQQDGKGGWFSSNRPGVFYLDETTKACCNDLFSFKIPEEKPQNPPIATNTPPKGDQPPTKSTTPPDLTNTPSPKIPPQSAISTPPIAIAPPQLSDFVGLPLYFDNDEPDKRTRRTTTAKSYEETVVAYLERQQEYRTRFSEGLSGEKMELAEDAIDNYFEAEVRNGYNRLFQLSDLIISRLQSGEKIEVFIKGFTSPRAKTDYNFNLGKRRISSVRNHFEQYAEGILQPYLRSGQLRITETSFGETTVRGGISDNLQDEKNSIYHPDAARERRVEIVEIKN